MGCNESKPETSETVTSTNAVKSEDVKPEFGKKSVSTAHIRRDGVSAEPSMDPDEKYTKEIHKKSAKEIERIESATESSTLFMGLTAEQKADVIDAMFEVSCGANEEVIKQGDVGNHFYVVHSGEYSFYLDQHHDGKVPVGNCGAGGSFGELALMYNCPRAATVKCRVKGKLWALDSYTFRHILMTANKKELDSTAQFLKSVSVLSPLTDKQRSQLADAMEEVTVEEGGMLLEQGAVADCFYLLKTGQASTFYSEKSGTMGEQIGRLNPGHYFGEAAMTGENVAAPESVIATSKCTLLKMERSTFMGLLGDLKEVIKFNFNAKVLSGMEMFKALSHQEKAMLIDSLEEVVYRPEATIISEGEHGEIFYIIKSGSVKVMKSGKVLKESLGPGEYFGEMALMNDEPRNATIIATQETLCMQLGREKFNALLGSMNDIIKREADKREREQAKASRPIIKLDELEHLAILGVGTFGRVRMVRHRPTKSTYALKCMRKGQVIALKQVEHVKNEKHLLDLCDHPFLLRLLATYQDADEIYMLLDLVLGGEMFSLLRERIRFGESQARFYAACVCSAFVYMHDLKMVYRDLKPENLLFDADGYVKVVDFGFAKIISQEKTWTLCGTPEYLAPEIITNKGHNLSVDWWSFGILIFEMLVGEPPFCANDQMEIYQKIIKNKISYPSVVSKSAKDLISKLLHSNPSQRLGSLKHGTRDVTNDPFFKTIDWKSLENRKIKAPYKPSIKSPTDVSNFEFYDEDSGDPWLQYNDKTKNLFPSF